VILLPGLLLCIAAAIVVSLPLELLGAFLVALGIRNQAASPFLEIGAENANA
jgi:hypothetical protein